MEDDKVRLDEEALDEVAGGRAKVDPNSSCPMGGSHDWKKVVKFNVKIGFGLISYVCRKCDCAASFPPLITPQETI